MLLSYVTFDTELNDYVLRFHEKCHENMLFAKLFLT